MWTPYLPLATIASDNVEMPADIIPFKLYFFASHARCAVQFGDAHACIKRGDVFQRHHLNGAKFSYQDTRA